MTLVGVPWFELDLYWSEVEPPLEKLFAKTREHRWAVADIKKMLESREAQLWVCEGGFVITQVVRYPRATECVLLHACGALPDHWVEMMDELVASSAVLGCTHASTYVRKGFADKLFPPEWRRREQYLVRELK